MQDCTLPRGTYIHTSIAGANRDLRPLVAEGFDAVILLQYRQELAALSDEETRRLFELIGTLKARGISIIWLKSVASAVKR